MRSARVLPRNVLLLLVPGLGPLELALIVFALLLIFGAKRIPLIARGLGEGIRDFKKSLSGGDEENGEPKRLESGKKDDEGR
jgi:sec-independent protein translocase protein TatA